MFIVSETNKRISRTVSKDNFRHTVSTEAEARYTYRVIQNKVAPPPITFNIIFTSVKFSARNFAPLLAIHIQTYIPVLTDLS